LKVIYPSAYKKSDLEKTIYLNFIYSSLDFIWKIF